MPGFGVAERLGFAVLLVGLFCAVLWLVSGTSLQSDHWLRDVWHGLTHAPMCWAHEVLCYGTAYRIAVHLVPVGFALRFLAMPAWRWLHAG